MLAFGDAVSEAFAVSELQSNRHIWGGDVLLLTLGKAGEGLLQERSQKSQAGGYLRMAWDGLGSRFDFALQLVFMYKGLQLLDVGKYLLVLFALEGNSTALGFVVLGGVVEQVDLNLGGAGKILVAKVFFGGDADGLLNVGLQGLQQQRDRILFSRCIFLRSIDMEDLRFRHG